MSQDSAIDAARIASDKLLASDLTPEQQQLVLDLVNATQELNSAYWEQVYANATTGGLTWNELKRLVLESSLLEWDRAEAVASHIIANAAKVKEAKSYWEAGRRTAEEARQAIYEASGLDSKGPQAAKSPQHEG